MNYPLVFRTIGLILLILAVSMAPSAVVGLIYNEMAAVSAFLLVIFLLTLAGITIRQFKAKSHALHVREGFLIVTLTWILSSLVSTLPLIFSGAVPDIPTAIYEATSGITTTGGSAIADVESLPVSINFWRGTTHWIGGLGVLTIAIAILPALGVGGFQIAKAESANNSLDKITPKITDMAKILYGVYTLLTVICVILLLLGGMHPIDAMFHAFSAISTGGFSSKNTSIAFYDSAYIETVLMVFMFIGGVNFALTYMVMARKKLSLYFANNEFRVYTGIVVVFSLVIFVFLLFGQNFGSWTDALRSSFFHVISLMTTTGLYTSNYDAWPAGAILLLFALYFVGGCSGSTTGSIKCARISIVLNTIRLEFRKRLHPRAVFSMRLKEKAIPSDVAGSAVIFVIFYILCFFIGAVVLSFDPGTDLYTAVSASAASLGNVGAGMGEINPLGNYAFFSGWAKIFMSFLMILGRLELFTLLLLFTPMFWNPDRYR